MTGTEWADRDLAAGGAICAKWGCLRIPWMHHYLNNSIIACLSSLFDNLLYLHRNLIDFQIVPHIFESNQIVRINELISIVLL